MCGCSNLEVIEMSLVDNDDLITSARRDYARVINTFVIQSSATAFILTYVCTHNVHISGETVAAFASDGSIRKRIFDVNATKKN